MQLEEELEIQRMGGCEEKVDMVGAVYNLQTHSYAGQPQH